MALRHENLIRFLLDTTSPGETIQYIPNPGNAGDSLISLGTLQLMDSLGLRVKLHNHKESFGKKDRVFFGGSGNDEAFDTSRGTCATRKMLESIMIWFCNWQ